MADYDPWSHHRSGWRYCVRAIDQQLTSHSGILFYPNLVSLFVCGQRVAKSSWSGFIHFSPSCFNQHASHFSQDYWKRNQEKCAGLYVLSEHAAKTAREYVDVPVCVVYHAAEKSEVLFSMDAFTNNIDKKVIFIGHWLRRVDSIYRLKTHFAKILLNCLDSKFPNHQNVTVVPYVSATEYDQLLQRNIVFVDLKDASANNVVIECIMRNTPLLIRDLPSVREYLGSDYPYYFSTLEEAEFKLSQIDLVEKTHHYLAAMDKRKLDINYFIQSMVRSSIYRATKI